MAAPAGFTPGLKNACTRDVTSAPHEFTRQFWFSNPSKKIELIAKRQKISAAEMVRKTIDAFNPDFTSDMADMADTDLLELVRVRFKEAITDTRKTHGRLSAALNKLEAKEG